MYYRMCDKCGGYMWYIAIVCGSVLIEGTFFLCSLKGRTKGANAETIAGWYARKNTAYNTLLNESFVCELKSFPSREFIYFFEYAMIK